ncbi:MAG: hypothetical protein Q9224_005954 [Gallowayella concinna]
MPSLRAINTLRAMFTAWIVFIGFSTFLTGATARRPPHDQVSASGFDAVELEESGVSTQSIATTSVGAIEGVAARLRKTTSPPTTATVAQTPHINSFEQTAHDEVSATGFDAAPTTPAQEQGSTTTNLDEDGQITLSDIILPHDQTTVQAPAAPVGGGGHGPLPEPETTVLGNDLNSILGGPGSDPPKDTPLQEDPKGAPTPTVGEPGHITATPAATPAPAPLQTLVQEPLPGQGTGHQPPGKEGGDVGKPVTIPVQTIVKPSPVITWERRRSHEEGLLSRIRE